MGDILARPRELAKKKTPGAKTTLLGGPAKSTSPSKKFPSIEAYISAFKNDNPSYDEIAQEFTQEEDLTRTMVLRTLKSQFPEKAVLFQQAIDKLPK
jgi:hypothetical protein